MITLDHPAPWFKWVTSLWLAAPIKKSDVDAVGSSSFGAVVANAPSQIHGNGAFQISEVVPKDHITLVPNKSYRTQPKLQKVEFLYPARTGTELVPGSNAWAVSGAK